MTQTCFVIILNSLFIKSNARIILQINAPLAKYTICNWM